MRRAARILLVAATAMHAAAAYAQAEELRADSSISAYFDEMDTVVWSPQVGSGATVAGDIDVDVAWKADVISSASVDVVTAATPAIHETRHEFGARLARERAFADIDIDGGYTYSFEQDGDSHVLELGGRRGFAQDNWLLGLTYSVSFNQVGIRNQSRALWRSLVVHGADLSVTRLLSKKTVGEVRYSAYYVDGYQASPYRRVPILMGPSLVGAKWLDEHLPSKRFRNSLTLRLRRAMGPSWVGAAEYRFYLDNWGLNAHTFRAEQAWAPHKKLSLHFHQRASLQGSADFYQMSYSAQTRHRSRDRRLSAHLNLSAGGSLIYRWSEAIELFLAADLVAWRYDEFAKPVLGITGETEFEALGTVLGGVMQLGLELRP